MKLSAPTRKAQFKQCIEKLNEFIFNSESDKTLAIFGGDLNIRDEEVIVIL